MAGEDIYLEAAEKLGYPGSASCVKFLRVLFTPEEAELLLEFIEPATCAQVAKRLNMNENKLQEKLDDFKRRRLLFYGKTEYVFRFGIHVFFARIPHAREEYIPEGFWEAWKEFHPGLPEAAGSISENKKDNPAAEVLRQRKYDLPRVVLQKEFVQKVSRVHVLFQGSP